MSSRAVANTAAAALGAGAVTVPLGDDLQREIDAVQQLRRVLHDAYIVESKESTGTTATAPPAAFELHRTVDAPTLALLKAPNYPFLLCEGAPPSYVPPPVPFDVEGEVDGMKAKVLQVQRDLVAFKERQRRSGGATHLSDNNDDDDDEATRKAAAMEELTVFLDGHKLFSELAWQVSSLEWFHSWVLSHSISHLWNAKDQLEFTLTENGRQLPQSAQEMDDALAQCSFTQAVSTLDNDRQAVIAQERRRLRSVSRTFRDRLPPTAITAATSCYLSSEEKYMYQEFYNQSEHLLLLFDHTVLVERSATMASGKSSSREGSVESHNKALVPRKSTGSATGAGAMTTLASGGTPDMAALAQDALDALAAEHEVIRTLMDTIRVRRRDNVQFAVSAAEYDRSRTAQVSVYGCLVSDMNLMAQQMTYTQEFLVKYEEWMRHHGFDSHDDLMQALLERSTSGGSGGRWPFMSLAGAGGCGGDGHAGTFMPPTEVWSQERAGSTPGDGKNYMSPAAAGRGAARAAPAPSTADSSYVSRIPDARHPNTAGEPSSSSSPHSPTVRGARARTPPGIAEIYYTILIHAEERYLLEISTSGGAISDDTSGSSNNHQHQQSFERLWLTAALRHTVARLAQSLWAAGSLLSCLDEVEEILLERLHERPAYVALGPNASALMVAVRELLTLTLASASVSRVPMTEVRVALHSSSNSRSAAATATSVVDDDLRRDVQFALGHPAESERWGALLDALWFQADPTGAASGGLLLPKGPSHGGGGGGSSSSPSLPGFQQMAKIAVPVVSSSSGGPVAVPVMTLYYRMQTSGTDTSGQPVSSLSALLAHIGGAPAAPSSPAGAAGASVPAHSASRRTSAATAAVAAAAAAASDTNHHHSNHGTSVGAQCATRYRLARAALAAFYEVEARGLLPCYACRVGECDLVPLESVLFYSAPTRAAAAATSDVVVYSVGLLPPPAVQLLRAYNQTQLQRPPPTGTTSSRSQPFALYSKEPAVSFASIGFLVASMLSNISALLPPTLKDLYLTAESTREQAAWECKNAIVPKSFLNASTHPIPMACAAAQVRGAMSIQREQSVPNRNSISLRRFISPLLRHLDDYLATADFDRIAIEDKTFAPANNDDRDNKTHYSNGNEDTAQSATGRRTAMNRPAAGTTSPSPSAVRPRGV